MFEKENTIACGGQLASRRYWTQRCHLDDFRKVQEKSLGPKLPNKHESLSSNSSTKKKEVLFGFLLIKLHRAVLRQH
jgi:hypothetical protein